MNVVVDMLANNSSSCRVSLGGVALSAGVLELGLLGSQAILDGLVFAMVMLTMLNGDHAVVVLLRQNLAVLYWLDGGVIMVLVDLTVDGSRLLFMMGLVDCLIDNGWGYVLLDGGVMVSRLGDEVLNGSLGFIHNVLVGVYLWC